MALSARRKLILAKIEAVYGTAIAAAAADAVLVSNASLTPITGGTADRALERDYYGASDQIPVNTHQQVSFGVEIAGPGAFKAANKPIGQPGWGKLLRACGFSETLREVRGAGNNDQVEYKPITGGEPSLTVRSFWAGQQHVLAGCRGNVSLSVPAADIPRFTFTLTGLWADPASVAPLQPDYSVYETPRPGSTRDTPKASLFGQDLRMRSFELDMGIEVAHREVIGADNEVVVVDRDPSGTIVIDMQPLSVWNPFTEAEEGAVGALSIVHGGPDTAASAGKLVEISCPKVQLGEVTYNEDSGILQASIPFRALPDAGNDEIVITAR